MYLYNEVKKKTKHASVQKLSFHFSGFNMEIQGWQLPKMPTITFVKEGSKKLFYSTNTIFLFNSTEQNGQTITISIHMNTMNATKKARR